MHYSLSRLVRRLLSSVTYRALLFGLLFLSSGFLLFWDPRPRTAKCFSTPDACSDHCSLTLLPVLNATVADLKRIRASVKTELAQLEKERDEKIHQRYQLNTELSTLTEQWRKRKAAVEALKADLESLNLQKTQFSWDQTQQIATQFKSRLINISSFEVIELSTTGVASLERRFDWSLCPLGSPLKSGVVLLTDAGPVDSSLLSLAPHLGRLVNTATPSSPSSPPTHFCVVYVFHCTTSLVSLCQSRRWNCVFLCHHEELPPQTSFRPVYPVARTTFTGGLYRPGYDIILPWVPPILGETHFSRDLHEILPSEPDPLSLLYRRQFLVQFCAFVPKNWSIPIVAWLSRLNATASWLIQLQNSTDLSLRDWGPCQKSPRENVAWLTSADFCLIPVPSSADLLTSQIFQQRLIECLYAGSVPLVISLHGNFMTSPLPLKEVIPSTQWEAAVFHWPLPRLLEIPHLLHTVTVQELGEKRRQGRLILERFLHKPERVAGSLNLLMSVRLHLPLPVVADERSHSVWSSETDRRTYEVDSSSWIEPDDYLGPTADVPVSSPVWHSVTATQHFTEPGHSRALGIQGGLATRGGDPDPFHVYPNSPWTGPSARQEWYGTEAPYTDLAPQFRPVNHSINGIGTEFSHSLGGNRPYEQFTVVFLGHSRIPVLTSSMEVLKDLAYLHSVIVVWNGPPDEAANASWPKLHVPVHVIRGFNNSLNNRFLPYDLIETEAVLSLDDDVQMRQDEIILAFRVWRQHTDQIVGFPARFHYRNGASGPWLYNANHTCQYSMILTGAAFMHKYYYHLYSRVMPARIRSMVDSKRNCEDLAMNFLVSHVTRKPPVKVTLRWTFACPKCASNGASLHERQSHYRERDACLNELVRMYGYNPLLYTQYRADSVLYKTRIPAEKQKCFKYV